MSVARALPATRDAVHCRHFGRCGGCAWLDRAYDLELAGKQRVLVEIVAAEPSLERVELLPMLGAAEPLFGRTAIKVAFGSTRAGPECGFFRRNTHDIVDLDECAVQHPLLTEFLLATRELAAAYQVPIYREDVHKGVLRHLLARVAPGTGQALIGLVTAQPRSPAVRRLAKELFARFSSRGLVGVVENLNERRTAGVLGSRSWPIIGSPTLVDEQDGLRVRRSITSFVQAHDAQASVLYGEVLRLLGDVSGRHVADLFAGSGPIALRLGQAGARVTAIERLPAAVRDGIAAARDNQLGRRVRFLVADAREGLELVDADGLDALVVDPPRAGLTPELIALLNGLRFGRMVYVSCNPETLVRDLALLSRAFAVRTLRPVDLFPRTEHLEVVALLERVG